MGESEAIVKFVLPDDHLFVGPETITNSFGYKIEMGRMIEMNLDIEIRKRILDCSQKQILSTCLKNLTDDIFGNEFMQSFDKYEEIERLRYIGINNFASFTECYKPCFETEYPSKILSDRKIRNIPSSERSVELIWEHDLNESMTSGLIIMHSKNNVTVEHEEVYEYNFLQFIGDAGGTIGVFLGLSFWSLYLDIFDPLLNKLMQLYKKQ